MRVVILLILIAITLSFNVNALAVVSDFLENDTLFLEDGTSKLYGIRLQNPSSEETQLKLTYDDTIAKIIDYEEIYTVPPKSSKAITFNITTPRKFNPGDTYVVSYTVHQLSGSGGGIPVLLKINKNFNVKIIRVPDKFYINYSYIAYAAIAVALLSYVFWKIIMSYSVKIRNKYFKK